MNIDILKGMSPVSVGDQDFINLNIDYFVNIKPIPTNRNSEKRVSKMKDTFDTAYDAKQTKTLTEVAIAIVTKDFEDPDTSTKYNTGDWYIVDGNTRANYWKQYKSKADALTNGVTAKIHYISSIDDVKFAYYPYNNAKSTEKASDILQGLANRYNWAPRQTVFANGGYKSAIDWASYSFGGECTNTDIFRSFNSCFDGLKILDSIKHMHGDNTITKPYLDGLKSQAILAAFLTMLRFHPNNLRLIDMIDRIANITPAEINDAISLGVLDPVQIIAIEYTGRSCARNKNNDAEPWLRGLARSTKFESKSVQMDFFDLLDSKVY